MIIRRDNMNFYYDFNECFKIRLDEKVCSFIMLSQWVANFKIKKKNFLDTLWYKWDERADEFLLRNYGKNWLLLFKRILIK